MPYGCRPSKLTWKPFNRFGTAICLEELLLGIGYSSNVLRDVGNLRDHKYVDM